MGSESSAAMAPRRPRGRPGRGLPVAGPDDLRHGRGVRGHHQEVISDKDAVGFPQRASGGRVGEGQVLLEIAPDGVVDVVTNRLGAVTQVGQPHDDDFLIELTGDVVGFHGHVVAHARYRDGVDLENGKAVGLLPLRHRLPCGDEEAGPPPPELLAHFRRWSSGRDSNSSNDLGLGAPLTSRDCFGLENQIPLSANSRGRDSRADSNSDSPGS